MRSSPPTFPRARLPWWPWLLAAAALLVVGLLLRGVSDPARPPHEPARSPAEPAPVPGGRAVPTPISVSVPAGFERDEAGAVEAAVAYVTCGQALLAMGPTEIDHWVRAMAASSTAQAQVDEVQARVAAVHRALAAGTGPLSYRQAALATRIDEVTAERARVSVWYVGVLSMAGVAPPQAGWAISVVDLVWEAGDWRLEREAVSPGPAPVLDMSSPPATAEELDAALAGFVSTTRS